VVAVPLGLKANMVVQVKCIFQKMHIFVQHEGTGTVKALEVELIGKYGTILGSSLRIMILYLGVLLTNW
jgi:hypothetical protein